MITSVQNFNQHVRYVKISGACSKAASQQSLQDLATSGAATPRGLSWCWGWGCLHVIIRGKVLKEVALLLHDAVELVNVNLTITITVSLVDHVLKLLIIDVLTKLLSHTGKVAEGDLVGVVVIEELEHLLDILARVLLAHLAGHHAEDLDELDGAVTVVVDVGDHLLELLVLHLEAKGTHGGLELTDVDGAGGIGVKEGESLTDLVKLLLGELTGLLLTTTTRHFLLL